jgi:prepilin-type N-terminal cleavage/methylation domain-containing protein
VKSLLTSNLLPSRLQYRISKPRGGSRKDVEGLGFYGKKNHNSWGFTLIELMIVVAILGILGGIGIPAYMTYLERAKVITAVAEIKMIMTEIEAYKAINDGDLPADLSVVGYQDFLDPWGNPYQYVNLEPGGGASLGPSFASVKKGTKVSVLEKRQPMGWSAAKANGLYAADGIFRKRFVESVRETIKKEQFKTTTKGVIVTTGGYGGNKRFLKTYSPAYHKNIMLVGSPLMEGGLLLAQKAKGSDRQSTYQ